MTTDIEDRLRGDLPRLADLIERDSVPDVVAVAPKRGTRRVVAVSIAAAVALAAILVGAAVRGGHHEHVSTTTPSVETTPSTWRALPPSPLGSRANTVVAWTGSEVLVWGGYAGDPNSPLAFQSGAAYDPATKAWRTIADNQWAHPGAIGVWGGDRLYVLAKNSGAYYLPAKNQWHDLPRLANELSSGFVGGATDGTTLYGIVYNENAVPPEIEVFAYRPGFTAWQARTPLHASLQPGVAAIPAVWNGHGLVSTVWSGTELVISDGGPNVWGYDAHRDTWHRLPSLPIGATATSLTSIGGVPVAVFLSNGGLKAARLGFEGWTVDATGDIAHAITEPLAVDAGGTLVVIDRAGKNPPVRADETGGWEQMAGYPLPLGTNGNAVSAGDGLFVWGGLPRGTSGPSDAAWYGK